MRDDDIPGLIADGVCDLGVVGRNVLLEQSGERIEAGKPEVFREWRALGFGACRLSIAVPEEWNWQGRRNWPASASPPAIPTCCGAGCEDRGSRRSRWCSTDR